MSGDGDALIGFESWRRVNNVSSIGLSWLGFMVLVSTVRCKMENEKHNRMGIC